MHPRLNTDSRWALARRARVMLRRVVLLPLLAVAGLTSLEAQSTACRTAADTADQFVTSLKGSYDVMDTVWMKSQGFPYAEPSAIALVTQTATCKSAVTAYNQASGRVPAVTSVYVAKLGKNGYVVMNPADQHGEYQGIWVFDTKWVMKQHGLH